MSGNLKLRTKMLLSILTVAAITFASALGYLSFKARHLLTEAIHRESREIALHHAASARAEIDVAADAAHHLAAAFAALHEEGGADRAVFDSLLRRVLEENPRFFGAFTVWEPDALDGKDALYRNAPGHDGTGRYVPWFNRSGGAIAVEACTGYDDPQKGDFYLGTKKTGKARLLDPATWEVGGKSVTIAEYIVPVISKGRFLGVVGIDLSLDSFQESIGAVRPFESGFLALLSANAAYVAYPDASRLGKTYFHEDKAVEKEIIEHVTAGKAMTFSAFSPALKTDVLTQIVPFAPGKTDRGWSLLVAIPMEQALAGVRAINIAGAAAGVAAMILLSFVVFLLTRAIVRPLQTVVALAERARGGDLTISRDDFSITARDELGQMADALAQMVATQRETLSVILGEAEKNGRLAESLAALAEESNASTVEIKHVVDQVANLAESNAAALEETNASIEEVASSATSSAQSSTAGAEASQETRKATEEAVFVFDSVIADVADVGQLSSASQKSMEELTQAVTAIAGFVTTISAIADQTNLLALNAAIEAARAGEQGRGFAVVAEEVRKLAEESNQAARQVDGLIESLKRSADVSSAGARQAGEKLAATEQKALEAQRRLNAALADVERINDLMQNIAAAAQEQAASSEEMASAVDQVSKSTVEMAESSQAIRRNTEELAQAGEGVAHEAQAMAEGAQRIRELLNQFRIDGGKAGLLPTRR